MTLTNKKMMLLGACSVFAVSTATVAEEAATEIEDFEEIVVSAKKTTFANNATDQIMLDQEPDAASVLSVIDNLPGIFVSEGGQFGGDDWSTTISIRGFTVSLSEQQVGMTIDGLPNGNSNYGGGTKANRYIDNENLARAEVSQGTADIASPSNEALGGTINFVSSNPHDEQRFWAGLTFGENNAQRYFVRYDTGEIAEGTTAYFSYSHQDADAWIGNAGGSENDHFAAKIVSEQDEWTFIGRLSYDDAHENNFQRISLAQFEADPDWDRLTDTITGIPYVDQAYRPGWGTLRENWFGYVKAEYRGDKLDFTIAPYYHKNSGRGDWIPPYLVSVSGGEEQSNGEIYGGSIGGVYTFVDSDGNPLAPNADCTATLTFPYGGGAPGNNPACYDATATPVGSYRHSHYSLKRFGVTADAAYQLMDNNTLRAGIWWEDSSRGEYRDWHERSNIYADINFNDTAYWRQYDRRFETDTIMLYAEDTFEIGDLTLRTGVKKFFVDLERIDEFGNEANQTLDSDSDLLFTAGAIYNVNDNLEVFAGFSQNFASIKDGVIEGQASAVNPNIPDLEPETADNFDLGLRFSNEWLRVTLTGYYIEFNNRITFVAAGDGVGGIDYLEEDEGAYFNVGGIESKGVEASVSANFADYWNFYSAVTINDSEYSETTAEVVEGNKVALAPEFQLVGTLSYYKDGLRAGVSAKHVGERYGNFANTDELPSFTTVDAWLGYTLQDTIDGIDSIDISVNVSNAFNEQYLGGGTPGSYFLGADRQATANLTMKF